MRDREVSLSSSVSTRSRSGASGSRSTVIVSNRFVGLIPAPRPLRVTSSAIGVSIAQVGNPVPPLKEADLPASLHSFTAGSCHFLAAKLWSRGKFNFCFPKDEFPPAIGAFAHWGSVGHSEAA